jgi:O-antigen/teichoic acid export membrane protein
MAGFCAWDLLESVAFGHQRMDFSSALSMLGAAAWLVWAWTVPETWLTPLSVSLAFAAVQAARVGAYLVLVRRVGWLAKGAPRSRGGDWRHDLLEPALPFYWAALITALTNQVPILFLAVRAGQAEVGLFNVGIRLVTPLQMLLVTAFTALYPGLARAATSSSAPFERIVRGALIGTVVLGTVGALLISALRREIVLLLFGVDYLAATDTVVALCWSSVLLALSTLIGTILAARDQQRVLASVSTVYVALSLPIFWFAAARGSEGLAFGIALTSGLGLVFHWLVFQRTLARPLPGSIGAALMGVIVVAIGFTWSFAQPLVR